MLAHRTVIGVYPEGHTIVYHTEYCIIFGTATQSRTSVHCLAVIFVSSFLFMERRLKHTNK